MESNRQTHECIQVGAHFVLNIGLGPGRVGSAKPKQWWEVVGIMSEVNRQIARAVRGQVALAASEDDEDTLILSGVFNDLAYNSTMLYDAIVESSQDCIAIYYPDIKDGFLMGPHRGPWGGFDYGHFKMATLNKKFVSIQ